MDERKKLELLLNIRKTFTTPLENNELFIETAPQYFDVETATKELLYKHWYDVPLNMIIKYRIHFWALTSNAFRFYLPAMLTAIIEHPHDVDTLTDFVIHSLTPKSDSLTDSIFIERSHQFLNDEVRVILKFLESYFDLFPPDDWSYTANDVRDLNRAIQFWSNKVGSG